MCHTSQSDQTDLRMDSGVSSVVRQDRTERFVMATSSYAENQVGFRGKGFFWFCGPYWSRKIVGYMSYLRGENENQGEEV